MSAYGTCAIIKNNYKIAYTKCFSESDSYTGEPHCTSTHPDHVPSVFPAPYGKQSKNRQEQRKERYDRLRKRYENYARRKNDEASPMQVGVTQEGDGPIKIGSKAKEAERETQEAVETLIRFSEAEIIKDEETQTEAVSTVDCAQQTEENLPGMLQALQKTNKKLQKKIFGDGMIEENDNATKFYTGLPKWCNFLMFLSPFITPSCSLSFHDELLLVLMKLRLNLLTADLAYRCG